MLEQLNALLFSRQRERERERASEREEEREEMAWLTKRETKRGGHCSVRNKRRKKGSTGDGKILFSINSAFRETGC